MSKSQHVLTPKILFYTADPVLALEIKALHLIHTDDFNISCKRQFSELKNALENYFHELLFLDLSHLSDPITTINIINKLSPATLIFLIDSSTGVSFSNLAAIINKSRIYRIISRPFNFNHYLEDIKVAISNARAYHKSLYASSDYSLLISDQLPNVILLHPDFDFGVKVSKVCAEIAQVSWAPNLNDLNLLLGRFEPWSIITVGSLPRGDCIHACHILHKIYPNMTFGMVAKENEKNAIIAGVNYFALQSVGTEESFLTDMESFLAPLLESYESFTAQNEKHFYLQSAKYPIKPQDTDEDTKEFLNKFETL